MKMFEKDSEMKVLIQGRCKSNKMPIFSKTFEPRNLKRLNYFSKSLKKYRMGPLSLDSDLEKIDEDAEKS